MNTLLTSIVLLIVLSLIVARMIMRGRTYTDREMVEIRFEQARITAEGKKEYYQKVLKELQLNGTLPAECDLKMPKSNVIISLREEDGGEVIAKDGKWLRLPLDNEVVVITYK